MQFEKSHYVPLYLVTDAVITYQLLHFCTQAFQVMPHRYLQLQKADYNSFSILKTIHDTNLEISWTVIWPASGCSPQLYALLNRPATATSVAGFYYDFAIMPQTSFSRFLWQMLATIEFPLG